MSLPRLRRWLARHPLAGLIGLALLLVGAQTVGVLHELSHGARLIAGPAPVASAIAPAGAAAAPGSPGRSSARAPEAPWHLGASGNCLTCLAVAALGAAAPAPVVAALAVDSPSIPWTVAAPVAFTPRLLRAYASRAPPRPHSA